MASYTASNGILSYTGTTGRDFFRFNSQYSARYFDIGSTVDGRDGIDEVRFDMQNVDIAQVNVILDLVSGYSINGVTYVTFSDVEDALITGSGVIGQSYTINGTDGANTLEGSSSSPTRADFVINGRGGNDILIASGQGSNVLNGGSGNDLLIANYYASSVDTLSGGTGDDTYRLVQTDTVVIELAGQGTDTVEAGISHTLGANVENLTLTGTGAINGIGNSLNNVIRGNSAANTITAGAGNDTLTGNGGGDTYVFVPGGGANVITDFDPALDTLDFSAFSALDQALLATPVNNGSGQRVYTAGAFSVSVPVRDDYLPGISGGFGSVTVGGVATGDIETTGDVDGFRVTLRADTTYEISILGSDSNNGTLVDPDLLGVFASSDLSGTPITSVQTLNTQFVGDDSTSYFTPQTAGEYFIGVQDAFGGTGTYRVAVNNLGIRDDFSADVDTTGSISPGGSATGRVDFAQDNDWFKVNLTANRLYEIELVTQDGDAPLADPYFNGIHDRNGTKWSNTANDDGGNGSGSLLQFVPDQSGTFYLSAGGYGTPPGNIGLN